MRSMFRESHFSGDISGWNNVDSCAVNDMFTECPIPEENKPTGGNPLYDSDGDYWTANFFELKNK